MNSRHKPLARLAFSFDDQGILHRLCYFLVTDFAQHLLAHFVSERHFQRDGRGFPQAIVHIDNPQTSMFVRTESKTHVRTYMSCDCILLQAQYIACSSDIALPACPPPIASQATPQQDLVRRNQGVALSRRRHSKGCDSLDIPSPVAHGPQISSPKNVSIPAQGRTKD